MQELEDHKIQNIQHFMKKTNPIDVVFRDKAKFDTQNPVINKLLSQMQTDKNDKAL